MRQFIDAVEDVIVHMRLHPVQNDGCADSSQFTDVVEVDRLIVHVALQSPKCIVCNLAEQNATSFRCVAVYIDKYFDDNISSEVSLLSSLPIVRSKNKTIEKEDWKKRRGTQRALWKGQTDLERIEQKFRQRGNRQSDVTYVWVVKILNHILKK